MNRIAVFAHYDKDSIIDDYVIYYLKSLKENFNKLIFISDCNLEEAQLCKLEGIADYVQAYHHDEYDWGSYKYGYLAAKRNNLLQDADEFLLCNDSVYGPIQSLNSIIEEMSKKECDFWGLYENKIGLNSSKDDAHLQSWFLMLKKKVFLSDEFEKFILSVTHLENKNDIIQKYEIGFTKKMSEKFKYMSAYTSEQSNAVVAAAPCMLDNGFPFLKTVVLRKYNLNTDKFFSEELRNIVKKHCKRVNKFQPLRKFFNTLKLKKRIKKYKVIKNW